jgi:hypothetical protein
VASVDDRPHRGGVPTVVSFYRIGAQFDRDPGVTLEPLRLSRVGNLSAARQRFNNQRYTYALTFTRDFCIARDFLALEIESPVPTTR